MNNDELFDRRHIMLYAKGHYLRSEDLMADMKLLVAERSAMSPENVRDRDIFRTVCDLAIPLLLASGNPKHQIEKLLGNVLKEADIDATLSVSSIISALLSFLAGVKTREVIIDLGKPDYSILPAS